MNNLYELSNAVSHFCENKRNKTHASLTWAVRIRLSGSPSLRPALCPPAFGETSPLWRQSRLRDTCHRWKNKLKNICRFFSICLITILKQHEIEILFWRTFNIWNVWKLLLILTVCACLIQNPRGMSLKQL